MTTASPRKRPPTGEPTAFELIEEAVHLLRRAPSTTLAVYYLGAGAWVLGFLFFWAHTTWFAPDNVQLAWSSLGLVVLFAGMKIAQAEFCARLLAQRTGGETPAWTWRRATQLLGAQLPVHAWGAILVPLAAIITLPLGWVYGFYQNVSVIGAGPEMTKEAREIARRWPAQNHVGLLLLSVVALAVWINCATSFYAVPWLANRLLGLDNIFGLQGWYLGNTTFFAAVAALTWLAVDPLVKAFYVLRVFYARGQQTGEDLRGELRRLRRLREKSRSVRAGLSLPVVTGLLLCVQMLTPLPARASIAETPVAETTHAVKPESLDRALDEVLQRRDFQWQLRPLPREIAREDEGALRRFLREGVEMIREMVDSLRRMWRDFTGWLDDLFGRDRKHDSPTRRGSGRMDTGTVRILLYALIAVVVVALIALAVTMLRGSRRPLASAVSGRAINVARPDLQDETTHAAQMPADGWLALAKEQIEKGDWRLALRALYLATLARHAADGHLTLAKHKTNLDYERELRRRTLLSPELATQFSEKRLDFESVWYGRDQADEARVRAWLRDMEEAAIAS